VAMGGGHDPLENRLPYGTPQWHVAANLRARGFLRVWGARSFWAAAASVVGRCELGPV